MPQELGLSQQQGLRQKLNPAQVRFGRVLEMSAPEFEEEVRRVSDENPALEIVHEHDGENSIAPSPESDEYASDDSSGLSDDIPYYRLRDTASHTAEVIETVIPDESADGADNLLVQLADMDMAPLEREIATYIIGNLDANGYLTRTVDEIADDLAFSQGLEVSPGEVAEALDAVRALEPAGIGARDLRDCLLLQLGRRKASVESRTATVILRDYFDLFSKKHFERIASSLDISLDNVLAAVGLIRTLNPKPGALLEQSSGNDRLRYIVPDFSVEADGEGNFTVALCGSVPDLTVEKTFRADNPDNADLRRRPEADAFLRARRDEAEAFIEMVRMRSRTLMAVMQAIVRRQSRFFTTYDRADIVPMVLRDIQAATGLDISVISRATATKYLATPRGAYPLKMFFNESVGTGDAETSQHAVAEAIKSLISSENPAKPLSDAAITDSLVARGYDVARRTVSKYRERLGYPVARLRRKI